MADGSTTVDLRAANLNLTNEEKRVYHQLFLQADTGGLGVVTGDVAVKFFERTKLNSTVLGQIWQIADMENRGLLTPTGFSIVLRLIGHCQAGRNATPEIALQSGPLPRFDDFIAPPSTPPSVAPAAAIQPQNSGPIRVPPLTQDKINQYTSMFDSIGTSDGLLSGDAARQYFEKARLPNEVLGRVWTLADTEQRGALGVTQFIIAMHLLASMRSGALRALPQTLPAGLFEAASRRSAQLPGAAAIPRQLSGQSGQRTSSPLARGPYHASPTFSRNIPLPTQSTDADWLITPQDKAKYDQIFATVDKTGVGYITGDEAVQFFSNSGLSEDSLASIWDLADINSEGKLNSDEFAVAMYLIRQQRARKDGRGDLPATLPEALVPPSMRQKAMPPQQPTAPAFDNATFAKQQSKSAADDLFGLDALADSAPVRQPTGPFSNDPFATGSSSSPPPTRDFPSPSRSPVTSFKPFIPTSSFGQGLTSQTTGSSFQSGGSQSRGISQAQPSTTDDLLGDNDPESSNKAMADSTELANMSNQIGILRTQMQSVQAKKSIAEVNVSQTSKQRQDLELRLSQFRTQYEQEVRNVKSLEEQLAASRAETRKMQQEFAMVDGAFKDLQLQRQTANTALEADQRENASLKEKIRQINTEVAALRPQLDKIKSDARQQKGLVAINKKQLVTSEAERNKLQTEIQQSQTQNLESAKSIPSPSGSLAASSLSPALSTGEHSTNPFFRSSTAQSSSNPMSPTGFAPEIGSPQGHSAFESVFGPSHVTSTSSGPPPTTFRSATDQPVPSIAAAEAAGPISPVVTSPLQDSQYSEAPPPPPEARQVTSNILPLHHGLDSTESLSSSVKANPPTSPFDGSRSATPIPLSAFATPAPSRDVSSMQEGLETSSTTLDSDENVVPVDKASSLPSAQLFPNANTSSKPTDTAHNEEQSLNSIPGAFPSDELSTPGEPGIAGNSMKIEENDNLVSSQTNPFTMTHENLKPSSTKGDFESAFDGFENKPNSDAAQTQRDLPTVLTSTSNSAVFAKNTNAEFPPIQDLNADESDSDSDGEAGFEDNFTAASPDQSHNTVGRSTRPAAESDGGLKDLTTTSGAIEEADKLEAAPAVEDVQTSSSHVKSVAALSPNGSGSNPFQEFGGLLPSQQEPTSLPNDKLKNSQPGFLAALFGTGDEPSDHNGLTSTQPDSAIPKATTKAEEGDEFDSAFDNLNEAQEADDQGQEDIGVRSSTMPEHEFDPTFDSPAPSKRITTSYDESSFGDSASKGQDLNNVGNGASSTVGTTQAFYSSNSQQPATSKDDWDDIFFGLDDSREADTSNGNPFDSQTIAPVTTSSHVSASQATTNLAVQRPPPPGRAITTSGEHDDPILQRLTGMGYPRSDALQALEKYDYNIEKAADFLTSRT